MTMTKLITKRQLRLLAGAALAVPLASCITVKAPDKPIEINLNVDIKQEVLVRLQKDVEQLINQNPEAFPSKPATTPPATKPAPRK
jgi:hypothetical protein